MIKNVCVFASSSNDLKKCFYHDAKQLGKLLGDSNFNVVYGGSRLGLMFACAASAKDKGSKIIGIMPKRICDFGVNNPQDCDEFIITEGMRERKAKMDELSEAVIALPGGFGTLEEISEMIVQKQLGYNTKAIILLNTDGFYDNLIRFFDEIILSKFAKQESREIYFVANSPEEAIHYLQNYKPKKVVDKISQN